MVGKWEAIKASFFNKKSKYFKKMDLDLKNKCRTLLNEVKHLSILFVINLR